MHYKIIIDILTAIGTIGALIIALAAIWHTNQNSKREIKTHKLEEIFELIQSLSRYYAIFKELYFSIESLQDSKKKEIKPLSNYYKIRDEKLPPIDRQKIIADLSRLEVLSKCYTEDLLLNKILKYEDLMYSFSDFVFNGGSLHKELKWKHGFPNYEEYDTLNKELKTLIIKQLNRK